MSRYNAVIGFVAGAMLLTGGIIAAKWCFPYNLPFSFVGGMAVGFTFKEALLGR